MKVLLPIALMLWSCIALVSNAVSEKIRAPGDIFGVFKEREELVYSLMKEKASEGEKTKILDDQETGILYQKESDQEIKEGDDTDKPSTHVHKYSAASCTEAPKCSCGASAGKALGHELTEASCTKGPECRRCGAEMGAALGHDLTEASCTKGTECRRCGAVMGAALGHDLTEPSCTKGTECRRCGAEMGAALGHDLTEPSCTKGPECRRRGAEMGAALGHDFTEASCTKGSECRRCGVTLENASGHIWEEIGHGFAADYVYKYVCNTCGAQYDTDYDFGNNDDHGSYHVEEVLAGVTDLGEWYAGMNCDYVEYTGDRCIACGEWR